jgi:hypothetical protein
MGRPLKLRDLRKILRKFGVEENTRQGKGSHTLFFTTLQDGQKVSYPMPTDREVQPCYVRGVRKAFLLLPRDGVSDDDFFGNA